VFVAVVSVRIAPPVDTVTLLAVAAPILGVVRVGLVANTNEPLPVSSVTAEARFALDGVARKVATPVPNPETPVLIGRPVQLVRVPLVGVPSTGVTRVGLVANTREPDPVSSVTNDAKFALDGVVAKVSKPVARVTAAQLVRSASYA